MANGSGKIGIAALACLLIGPALANIGIASPFTGFKIFGLGAGLGLGALLAGILSLVRGGGSKATLNLALGGAVVGTLLVVALPSASLPKINDITTDTVNPPAFVAARSVPENAGRDMAYPGESFARQQAEGYPDLAPLTRTDSPEATFLKVTAVVAATPEWTVLRTDTAGRVVEATATSRLFRFQDDFVIEVRAAEGGGSVVHMRSKSRDGRGDMGANAARIKALFAQVQSGN